MRFSIRSLLAVIFLCGLVFPVIQGLRAVELDLARQAELRNEIEVLRTRLDAENAATRQVRKHQAELFTSVALIRRKAESQFDRLQEKYGKIEAVDSETLSLRTVPQLNPDGGSTPTVFRIVVPALRDVWLKYAVIPTDAC